MSLKKYDELRSKIVTQMEKQVNDVKVITVEQWAKENGFSDVHFSDYDEAQKWIEDNINTKKKLKKKFYDFESEVDDSLECLTEELENGSSSALTKAVRNINQKYISPAVKTLLKSVAINFAISQGVRLGLTFAGAKAHKWATSVVDKINVAEGIDFGTNFRNISRCC